ncbi:MAG TPA: hypothetical protein VNX68_12840 [Nitrosopumilaceae archaeon]|nr:hypothetical protein [Nitrosopumilaceae archaeon]
MTTDKTIQQQVLTQCLYLKGISYMSEENAVVFWENYKKLYEMEYPGNKSCGECRRNELKRMIIEISNENEKESKD